MFVPFVLRFEGRRPQARELVLLATMTALAVAGRRGVLLAAAVQARVRDRDPHGRGLHAGGGLRHRCCGWPDLELFLPGRGRGRRGRCSVSARGLLGGVLFSGRKVAARALLLYGFLGTHRLWCAARHGEHARNTTPCPRGSCGWRPARRDLCSTLIHAGATAVFLLLLCKPLLSKLARVKEKVRPSGMKNLRIRSDAEIFIALPAARADGCHQRRRGVCRCL